MNDQILNCSSDCKGCKNVQSDKLPLITSAFLILTERCNLACTYCFVKQNPAEMTYETAMDAIQFLIRNAEQTNETPDINFFGGEPLLKWNEIIVPLVRYIREEYKKPFRIGMTSNGVLLNQEKLDFMKEHEIGLLFSIDGDKHTQDTNRPFHNGRGSFDKLKEVIPLVLAFDKNSTFRATIDQNSVEHTYHNMRFAYEMGYNNMFFIPDSFAHWTEKQKHILKEQMRLFSDWFIEEMRQEKVIALNPFCDKINEITRINNAIKKKQFRASTTKPGEGKCGLGANKFASIGTDGTLYGCQEMTSNTGKNKIFIIGDIYEGADEQKRHNLIKHFSRKDAKGANCDTCLLHVICDGGCVANNYLISGDMNKMPDIMCYWYQLLLDEAIYVCDILGAERNVFFKERFFSKNKKKKKG